jgi:hypothetical protein
MVNMTAATIMVVLIFLERYTLFLSPVGKKTERREGKHGRGWREKRL